MPEASPDQRILRQAILRQATRADLRAIAGIHSAVPENMLFPGMIITPERVLEAIEITGRGWVIEGDSESGSSIAAFAIGNATYPDTRAHPLYLRLGWQQSGVASDRELHMELHRPSL